MAGNSYPVIREKTRGLVWVALIAVMAIAALLVFDYAGAQDNDQWWLLATGREIVTSGIPYMNPFDVYGDQAIVVQQWIPAVLDYMLYESLGYVGFGLCVLVQGAIVAALAVSLGRKAMGNGNLDIACIVAAMMISVCSAYMSIRPQMWSMIAFLAILNVMESYRRSDNWKTLIWLPVIVIVHANVHMAMMPFDFVIVACYMLPSLHTLHLDTMNDRYHKLRLLIPMAAMALAALCNPYGIDGAMYLVNSYGAASYGNYIAEMGTTPTDTYYGIMMIASMIVGSMALGRLGLKKLNLPLTALFLMTLVLSFQHTRNVWLVALFAVPLVCSALETIHLNPRLRFLRDDAIKIISGTVGVFLILIVGVQVMTDNLVKEPTDTASTPIEAADWLDSNAETGAKVFTHFNAGGYMEWRGYRVGMDPRPELWNAAISKNGVNRYKEYIDMSQDKLSCEEYLSGKDFDYLLVNTDTELYKYLTASEMYSAVKNGSGYVLFAAKTAAV